MTAAQLQDALRLRRGGRLAEAAQIYAEVLKTNPQDFEALHALGILCYQTGQLEEAERLVAKAVESNPNAPDAHYNHACLLQKLDRCNEAMTAFDAALALKPGYVEALANRGNTLMSLKRHEDALASFDTTEKHSRSSPTTSRRSTVAGRRVPSSESSRKRCRISTPPCGSLPDIRTRFFIAPTYWSRSSAIARPLPLTSNISPRRLEAPRHGTRWRHA